MRPVPFLLVLASLAAFASAATAAEWRSRSIYQVFTDRYAVANGTAAASCDPAQGVYCGGTWRGVADQLDYIQGMGFSAIWISPVTYQVTQDTPDLTSYHGYWQQDLYQLNPKFGTAADLKALADAVHSRGMLFMADIVTNHFAWNGAQQNINYSNFHPFNDEKYFHPYCLIEQYGNTANQTVLDNCWLGDDTVTLPDLRTEDSDVQAMFGNWVRELVSNYSIDGLRIDSALNVNADFWPDFVNASGVFATGEVMNGDTGVACPVANAIGSMLNYPAYYPLTRAFSSTTGSINDLVNQINGIKASCQDPTVLGSFSENHDVPRFASYTPDLALAQNVLAYTVFDDGIPIVYQGQEQHLAGGEEPLNREALWPTNYTTAAPLYGYIHTLNTFRAHAVAASPNYTLYNNWVIYQDLHTFAMRKGYTGSQTVLVLTNNGATQSNYTFTLPNTGYAPGTDLVDVLSCAPYAAESAGNVTVAMAAGAPRLLYPHTLLKGSGLCGTVTTDTEPPSAAPSSHPDEMIGAVAPRSPPWSAALAAGVLALAVATPQVLFTGA